MGNSASTRSRRPRAELRDLLLRHGVALLLERGLEGGAPHIGLSDVFARVREQEGVRVTQASVYGRLWATQSDFQRDLLLAAAAFYPDGEERPTLEAARSIIAAADRSSIDARWRALSEVCRVAGAVHIRVLEASRAWQIWVGVWALTVSTPSADDDRALGPSIQAGHRAATRALEAVLGEILDELGFRVRAPLTLDHLALVIGATAEGLALRDRFAPDEAKRIERRGVDGLQRWTLFGVTMEAIVLQLVEPVPRWRAAAPTAATSR